MRKGYGKASILVHENCAGKIGEGARDQGRYMMKLGDEVCPAVWEVFEGGYIMEKLDELPAKKDTQFAKNLMTDIFGQLQTYVWTTPQWSAPNWRGPLRAFMLLNGRGLGNWLDEVYPKNSDIGFYRIHGDPTFCNVMFERDTSSIKLIDPIQPIGKIPSVVSVDLAKIAQSVIGWEHVALGWPKFDKSLVSEYLLRVSHLHVRNERVFVDPQNIKFWLMVHLVRILPYVTDNMIITRWAKLGIDYIWNHKEEPLCDTLTTLMELSHSQKKPSSRRTKR